LACARALGCFAGVAADSVPSLALVLGRPEEDEEVRLAAAEALGAIGQPATPELQRLLLDVPCARAFAAQALGRMAVAEPSSRAVLALEQALESEDARVRKDAAAALGAAGAAAAEAAPALARLLNDEVSWVRWEAADALGSKLGGEAVVPALVRSLGDENEWARVAAACALGRLGVAAVSATDALEVAKLLGPEMREASDQALARIARAART